MNETTKALQPLRRGLPVFPPASRVDEDGETWRPGFAGNCSQSPLYVTDGHILLLAAAIDPRIALELNEESYVRKYANETEIRSIWTPVENRIDVTADFIGVYEYGDVYQTELAFLRDEKGRVMVLNAYLLAFGIHAVRPDSLTVSEAPTNGKWFDSPLALRSNGKVVGLIMPIRVSADEFHLHSLDGDPIKLADLLLDGVEHKAFPEAR